MRQWDNAVISVQAPTSLGCFRKWDTCRSSCRPDSWRRRCPHDGSCDWPVDPGRGHRPCTIYAWTKCSQLFSLPQSNRGGCLRRPSLDGWVSSWGQSGYERYGRSSNSLGDVEELAAACGQYNPLSKCTGHRLVSLPSNFRTMGGGTEPSEMVQGSDTLWVERPPYHIACMCLYVLGTPIISNQSQCTCRRSCVPARPMSWPDHKLIIYVGPSSFFRLHVVLDPGARVRGL